MRIRTGAFVFAVLLLSALGLIGLLSGGKSGLSNIPAVPGSGGEVEGAEEEEGGLLSPVGDWLFAQRSARDAIDSARAYEVALDQAAALLEQTRESAPRLAEASWEHIAPKDIGGRVSEVAVDPTAVDTVYAATASGGVWKSVDAGLTWTSAWPTDTTQAMGGLAIASDGTIYAGTGEPTPAGGYVVSAGSGVYRSEDSGATWTSLGLEGSGAIGRIAIDPSDPDRVFVAAAGHLLFPGGERGLYRSTDGGEHWDRVLEGENPTTGAIDVAIDPLDTSHMLAATWDRDVVERRLTGPGSGVHLSTDGGDTWEEVSLPGNADPAPVGRIGVAFAPSDPQRAYAVVANDRRGEGVGLWRSDDGGRTWKRTDALAPSLAQANYGWWFGRVSVDPRNEDRLFVAAVRLIESTDAGDSFVVHDARGPTGIPITNQVIVSANEHSMAWDLTRPGRVYLGNDSGIFRSGGNGNEGTWVRARVQGWTQHYSVASASWTASRPQAFGESQTAGAGELGTLTAVVPAPSDPNVIYTGNSEGRVWRSDDSGGDWDRLGDSSRQAGPVTHIAVDEEDADSIFVVHSGPASDPSHLYASSDAGDHWIEVGAGLPSAPINDVVVIGPERLAVATDVGVFLREGSSWQSVGSNLPAVPVLDIRFQHDDNSIIAATFGHGIQRVVLPEPTG
ncbi:MAG: WD40/YVTN/BNR-like repeat-containing protein [Actinomycetota bacterium]